MLCATSESKAILRSVAGELCRSNRSFDYFPSFEIISNSIYKGMFYEPNMRNVNMRGVDYVMEKYFESYLNTFNWAPKRKKAAPNIEEEVFCEEELLQSFG